MNYFIRFTENPRRDLEHPVSFYAISDDPEYLAMLDPDAEIVEAGEGMWGIATAEEGLCCYGPFESVHKARAAVVSLRKRSDNDEPWLELPAVIFWGEESGVNDLGDVLFIPEKIIEVTE